jgi:sulfur-oxidizing protein SoxY
MDRLWGLVVMAVVACAVPALAQEPDPDANATWQKVRADLFGDAPIAAGDNVVALEVPARAQDASVVPVSIRAGFAQGESRSIERVWLVVDGNPSPIAAIFRFTRASGRADIDTRIRIEQYSYVRAIAATSDGTYHMVARYVKASGGCSAPPPANGAGDASARLGRMRILVDPATQSGSPASVRVQVSHPNDSGLAMDQLSRTYTPAHFVRTLEVRQAGELVLSADLDFAISENPYFRFRMVADPGAPLEARVVDNQSLEFSGGLRLQARE